MTACEPVPATLSKCTSTLAHSLRWKKRGTTNARMKPNRTIDRTRLKLDKIQGIAVPRKFLATKRLI